MKWSFLLLLITLAMATIPAKAEDGSFKGLLTSGQNKAAASRFSDARKDYAQALALAATDAQKYQTQSLVGLSYVAEGNFSQAREEFAKVVKTPGASAFFRVQAHSFIALAYGGEGKFLEARTEQKKILDDKDATPHDKSSAQFGIAMSYFDGSEFGKSRDEFEKYLKMPQIEPALAGISQLYVGRAYVEEREFAKGRGAFVKVLTMRTGDTDPQFEFIGQRNQQEAQREIARSYVLQAQDEYSKLLQTKGLSGDVEKEARKNLSVLKAITEADETAKPDPKKEPSPDGATGKSDQGNRQQAQMKIAKSYVLQAQDEYSKLLQAKGLDAEIEKEARKSLSVLKAITGKDETDKPASKKVPSRDDAAPK